LLTKYAHANDFCTPPNLQDILVQKFENKDHISLYTRRR